VARVNPYAHCLIYIGHRKEGKKEIHEVVHTAMASIGSGVLKATIRREPVLIVKSKPGTLTTVKFGPIKADDHVFLGHKLVSCQFAANIHKMIVDRAVKCSEEPSLVFDYDYKSNCETFCNMIFFGVPCSTQSPQTVGLLKGLFCLIGCLKQPEEKALHVQMEERINGKKICSYE